MQNNTLVCNTCMSKEMKCVSEHVNIRCFRRERNKRMCVNICSGYWVIFLTQIIQFVEWLYIRDMFARNVLATNSNTLNINI